MEKAMIQMTWPDDNVLDDIWVKVRVCSMALSFSRCCQLKERKGHAIVGHTDNF